MRRTLIRTVAGIAVAAGLALPTSGHAAPTATAAGGYPELTGTTNITAHRSSYAIVDVPKAVRFRTEPGPGSIHGLDLEGAGRFIGLSMVSLDGRRGFAQLRMAACWQRGCSAPPVAGSRPQIEMDWGLNAVSSPSVDAKIPDAFTLPAGRYVLSVFADGSPVHVRLRLPGLTETSRLPLHLDRHALAATPAVQRIGAGPLTTATSSTADGTVHTNVVVLGMVHRGSSHPHVSNDEWWCFSNDPPPGGVTAPYCPTGSGIGTGITWVTMDYRSFGYGVAIEAGPGAINGRVYQGVSDSGVQNLGAVHDNFFWGDAGLPHQGG